MAEASTSIGKSSSPKQLSPSTRRIALIVSGTFFMEQLDSTITAAAIPAIARSLGTDPVNLNLTMTAYLVGLAALVPVSGRIADRFGTRTVFALATAMFVLASLFCGLAETDTQLIASRFFQGIAGALMAPVGRLIVLRAASRTELVEAMAVIMVPAMVAPMLGPVLGGIIVTWLPWEWIFFINIPLGLSAIAFILRTIPQERAETPRSMDAVGAVLVGTFFVCLGLACEGATSSRIGGLGAHVLWLIAALSLLLYAFHVRRHRAPAIDLRLLSLPNFRHALIGGSVFRIAVGGVPFLLPIALQLGHGLSPLVSGCILLLPAVGGLAMKFFSTSLLRRHGYRPSLLTHGLLSAIFLSVFMLPQAPWSWWMLAPVLVLFGFSRSLLMNAYGTLAYAEVSRERMADATSFFLAIQNLTNGLGVAFAASAIRIAAAYWPDAGTESHFTFAFGALTACAAISVAMSFLFDRDAGAELVGRPRVSSVEFKSPMISIGGNRNG